MEVSIDDDSFRKSIERLSTGLPAAAKLAAQASTKKLAEKLAERVRELIPDDGGWYDIYRAGVQLVEITPGQYEISAKLTNLGFDDIEAATTLLWFNGGDDVGKLLGADNPWTVDTIPAIAGGFSADIIVRPGSDAEVDFHRRKQRANSGATALMLDRLGHKVDPNALPLVSGRVLADVPFLARRLEFGLGGFPRTQIWGRLSSEKERLESHPEVTEAGYDTFSDELDERLD